MSKTSYLIGDPTKFQLPWHNYGNSMFKPDYSEEKILELFRGANPKAPIKRVKITPVKGSTDTRVEVKHGDGELNIPDALKKYLV